VTKTKERVKKTGEVFTPPWLVNQMLDELDKSSFDAPGKTFVDPACGNGNILVEVIRRKINNGCTAYQSLMTTYGNRVKIEAPGSTGSMKRQSPRTFALAML
jgi:hypothetical protein